MSSRQLRLDGPDLPELIRQAESAGGRVVRAVRTRRGLLQRRWFEITVELPRKPANVVALAPRGTVARPPVVSTRGGAAAKPGPAGLDDLLAAAEAAERYDTAVSRSARQSRAASSGKRRGR